MENVLSSLSESLAEIVEQAGQSIVRVEGGRMPSSGIIWSDDGAIVTAQHSLEKEEDINVGLPDGETVRAALVGRDPATDIAVIRTGAKGLISQSWAETDGLRVGHLVLALGRPGKTVRASLGIVSALGEGWVTQAGGRLGRYLQSDVTLYPGFSGGPLVNVNGRFLGLNTVAGRGIPVTVPTVTMRKIVNELLSRGKVERGYLGISTQPLRLASNLAENLGQESGLLVTSVNSGSPADRAGIMQGDILVAISGQPTRRIEELFVYLGSAKVGATVPVKIIRGGEAKELSVVIGERE